MCFWNDVRSKTQGFFSNGILFSITVLALVLNSLQLKSQVVENVTATVKNDIIIVSYDLISDSDKTFDVNLYSSRDNFQEPLTLVTGDIGPNVEGGKGKRIELLAQNELQGYSGSLIFEIRAVLPQSSIPLEFQNFSISKIKSGKSYKLQWKGGKENEKIAIYLLDNGMQKARIATVENDGKYLWKVPKGSQSSNYQLQLKGESGIATSSDFQIKKGFPVLIVGGGAIVAAGVIIYLITRDSSSGSGNNSNTTGDLPVAPDPN